MERWERNWENEEGVHKGRDYEDKKGDEEEENIYLLSMRQSLHSSPRIYGILVSWILVSVWMKWYVENI